MSKLPIRFGYQISLTDDADPVEAARRAEAVGFDTFLVADHIGHGRAPMPVLAAVAAATDDIRLGTFVLNSDMRNPVQLAWEATSIDHLSGGRLELGLGAGHTPQEYSATGATFHSAGVRKARLAERVEIIRRLLDGENVDWHSEHHHFLNASIDRSLQPRLPLLVAGSGAGLLGHAGRHADIVGLTGLGRTNDDGHTHQVLWSAARCDRQVDQIRTGAGERFDDVEINVLVQFVHFTDDVDATYERLRVRVPSASLDDLREAPYVLVGTTSEIIEKLDRCRRRWGIGYFAVRELDAFAPVIAALGER